MQIASSGIYLIDKTVFVHPQNQTTAGVWIFSEPIFSCDISRTEEVGAIILKALALSKLNEPHPKVWKGLIKVLVGLFNSPTPPPHLSLFEYARSRVSQKDIEENCPSDPGYPEYVSAYAEILSTGIVPKEWNFDLSEAISLNGFSKADDSESLRRFRIFAISVGIAIDLVPESFNGFGSTDGPVILYMISDLLEDAFQLNDSALIDLLPPVLKELREALLESPSDIAFAPFMTLAQMIVGLRQKLSREELVLLSSQLRQDEASARKADCQKLVADEINGNYSLKIDSRDEERINGRLDSTHFGKIKDPVLLWDCTNMDQHHDAWKKRVKEFFPTQPMGDPLVLLRDDLLPEALTKNSIYAYKRPDSKWGLFALIKFGSIPGDPRRTCWVETFGEPAPQAFSGTDEELKKLSLWKRTLFQIFEDRILELQVKVIRHECAEITDRHHLFLEAERAFDSKVFFWLDLN